ncbi:TRAP transporter large permease [Arhodomonas sp. SL1]|uniref:TRAP transporter large permease n=1 Tax=Arhodomonas sp. SL1 TaxID=3425691 RepID=UPI003F882BB8
MGEGFWPLAMLAALVVGIFSGYPVALVLAGTGIVFAFLADIPALFLSIGVSRVYSGILTNWLLIAIPLFVYMGLMLERSGVAERLLGSLAALFRGLSGGYGFAVVVIGVVMAASTGIIGASVVLMGMMALPTMLRHGYDPRLSTGVIAASGTLGILIPPSIMLIVLGDQLQVSVGDLFMGAVGPGLLLGALYLGYLAVVALVRPQWMPALPRGTDERPLGRRLASLALDLLAPVALIICVLGSIVAGIATPTEAAAIGAAGATLLALMAGGLHRGVMGEALRETTRTTAMIVFVMIGASLFSLVFKKLGGDDLIAGALAFQDGNPYWVILTIMVVIFVLGFFLEWVEITLVVIPLLAPVVAGLDLGLAEPELLVWFAIALSVNLQTSFLTPPFGYALFYLRGIAPPEISIATIYRGVVPFVILQLLALAAVIAFPAISLWLPRYLAG